MSKNIIFILSFVLLFGCQSAQQNNTEVSVVQPELLKYQIFSFPEIMEELKINPDKITKNKYSAQYYPVRIYHKIPYKIKNKARENEKIVMLTPKGGKYRLYMLFPGELIEDFEFYARKHKKITFICQPLQLFNKRSPLIRLDSIVAVN